MNANAFTEGDFHNEDDAWEFFDNWIDVSGGFRVYREVWGRYLLSRPFANESRPRIDRFLIPKQPVLDAGWIYGPIGIEGKKSGHKIGKAVSQALDYSAAVFEPIPGFHFNLESVFVFPVSMPKGDVASVMTQNRIGCVRISHGKYPLTFQMGGTHVIELQADQSGDVPQISFSCKPIVSGRKRGSR